MMKIFYINFKSLRDNLKTKRTDSPVYFDLEDGVRLADCLGVTEGDLSLKEIVLRKVITSKKTKIFARGLNLYKTSFNSIKVSATVDNGDGTFSTTDITRVPSIQNIVSTEEVPVKEDVTLLSLGEDLFFISKIAIADIFIRPEDNEDVYLAFELI
jgi:hypothetical protein